MERKNIYDQKLKFNMDYKEIAFVSSDNPDGKGTFSDPTVVPSSPPIYYYVPDEIALQLPFYALLAGHFLVGSKFYTKREHMCGYMCILTLDGGCTMEIEGQKPFECTKNTLTVVDCMKKHYFHTSKYDSWNYMHFHFDTNLPSYIMENALGIVSVTHTNIEENMVHLFQAIRSQRPISSYLISDYISQIVTKVIALNQENPVLNAHSELLEEFARYLRDHFSENINVGDIASNQYYVSKYYFTRLFKDYYGLTPYAYLTNYRVQKAKECLFLNMSISETASHCGFGNINNFTRIFKHAVGITPSEFKKFPI